MEIRGPLSQQSAVTTPILRALPGWFGIETATQHYIQATDEYPTFVAYADSQPVGFLTIYEHSAEAAEIYVMGVQPNYHRRGIGRALVLATEAHLRKRGFRFLQVKTLSPKHPDPGYALTRQFYFALGFVVLEEFPELWGAANPALQLVKAL